MAGSTECSLIWREKVTPAGRSIFRLAPSMRRTSGSGSTGSPWPTPISNDATGSTHCYGPMQANGERKIFLKLPGAAQATWPTPTAVNRVRDEETMAKCAAFRLRNANQKTVPLYLGEVVEQTATLPTPTTRDGKNGSFCPNVPTNALLGRTVWTGDQAQTEKRGALNPAFVCWLMGFPIAWDDCGASVTPLSRRSQRKSSAP